MSDERTAVPGPDLGGGDFEEFAASTLPALLRFGHVLTGSLGEAEDLVQKALAKSLRRWRRVSADDPVAHMRKEWPAGTAPLMNPRPPDLADASHSLVLLQNSCNLVSASDFNSFNFASRYCSLSERLLPGADLLHQTFGRL